MDATHLEALLDQYWPRTPGQPPHAVRRMMARLVRGERVPRKQIIQSQTRRLLRLARHHLEQSEGYRERAAAVGVTLDTLKGKGLKALPILTREDLRDERMFDTKVTPQDIPLSLSTGSGSTGRALSVRHTRPVRDQMTRYALRELLWLDVDPTWRYAEVRYLEQPPTKVLTGKEEAHWPGMTNVAADTGPYLFLPICQPVRDVAKRLRKFEPELLRTYPRTLLALTEHLRSTGGKIPSVRAIRTLGEGFSAEERARVREFWGVPLIDCYGSAETGQIAFLCEADRYHINAEVLIAEVVDTDGKPCAPGVSGRLLLTHLANRATPIVRYDVGDLAAHAAGPCPCGRTSPTLASIDGRQLHMLKLPDGSEIQFLAALLDLPEPTALGLCQVVQQDRKHLLLRYQGDRAKPAAIEQAAAARLNQAYGTDFKWTFEALPQLPSTPAGKVPVFVPIGAPDPL